jgi:hypothetical protein
MCMSTSLKSSSTTTNSSTSTKPISSVVTIMSKSHLSSPISCRQMVIYRTQV